MAQISISHPDYYIFAQAAAGPAQPESMKDEKLQEDRPGRYDLLIILEKNKDIRQRHVFRSFALAAFQTF